MTRHYEILYKSTTDKEFARLEPVVHAGIYNKPEVHTAVALMAKHTFLAATAVIVESGLFNIMVRPPAAGAYFSFEFPSGVDGGYDV